MQKIRFGVIVVIMSLCLVTAAAAQVSIGIGLPNVSIGINLPVFPVLTRVPGYPVYYAPQMSANYFFYDGMYWVYQDDTWYASSWYNGPWGPVEPEYVPLFILRIPVRYYRQPPVYFRGWQPSAPPRWGQHWGHEWEQRRSGWNTWNRRTAPAPAPLPSYQKRYTGDRYPRVEQQHQLRGQNYRYQPRDKVVREHFRAQPAQQKGSPPAQRVRQEAPPARNPGQHEQRPQIEQRQQREQKQQVEQRQQHEQRQQTEQRQQREQKQQIEQRQQREQPAPRVQEREQRPQERGESQDSGRGRGQGQNKDEERGRGRDR
ncbi:MAG: hypothetical protein IPQ16_07205 [Geobacteraceae bacterium]|nr:hypothetical protein [Geobacteraceae bacterium]